MSSSVLDLWEKQRKEHRERRDRGRSGGEIQRERKEQRREGDGGKKEREEPNYIVDYIVKGLWERGNPIPGLGSSG